MKHLLIAFSLLFGLILSAPSAMAATSVVEIEAGENLGSGTSVAQGILTNAHVVGDLKTVNVCEPQFPFTCKKGKVVKIDKINDLALVRTTLRTKPLPICQKCNLTNPVSLYGLPDGYYQRIDTKIDKSIENYFITYDVMRPGASGGAATIDGNLLGIITRASVNDGTFLQTYLIKTDIIKQFLSWAQ